MKKSILDGGFHCKIPFKYDLKMKLTTLLLLVSLFTVNANSYSQNTKITLHVENVSVADLFTEIESLTDFRFLYNHLKIDVDRKVSVNVKKERISDILESLFSNTNIEFKVRKKLIILTKKSNAVITLSDSNIESGQDLVQASVKGIITDENGAPLAGASVLEKGTTNGTQSDFDGKFSLELSDSDATLAVSYIGFASQEIALNGRTDISVVLKEDAAGLEEVVVVGYSSQSRRDLTSAVVTVKSEEINKRVATNPTQLLQGKLPGLQIVQNSGEPGNENFQLRIRGRGTFSDAGSNPLVIVDGLPGSLSSINPNDIESVSVLKDAASAAIYGSRGANGVIVVTTKKGSGTRFTLEVNSNVSINQANKLPDFITNSAEYMELRNEALVNVGAPPLYTQEHIDLYRNAVDRVQYPNYNWVDEMFRTALVSNHYLSASGANGGTRYNISLGYSDQPGVFHGFEFEKYTSQFNISSKVNDRVTLGMNTLLSYGERKGPRQGPVDQFLSTLAAIPMAPPKLADGRFVGSVLNGSYSLGNKNPVAIYNTTIKEDDVFYVQSNMFLDVELFPGLTWETRAGINYGQDKSNDFRPTIPLYDYTTGNFAYNLDVGSAGLSVREQTSTHFTMYSQLNYEKTLNEKHALKVIAGWQQEKDKYEDLRAGRNGFPTNVLRELNAGPTEGQTNYGNSEEWALRSYYGTANYAFDDKYLLGSSVRYDGTSRLPVDSRWGLFYSFSAGWRISSESFLQDAQWLDDLKIRGSWGELGNQNIGNYPYQNILGQTQYNFGGSTQIGFRPGGLTDPNLTWETTRITDVGFDATLFGQKLSLVFDYYIKETFDILRSSQVPEHVGLEAPIVNNGTMQNKGFEVSISYRNTIGKDWSYSVDTYFDTFKNKLTGFGAEEIGGRTIKREGLEYDQYYMFEWDGIFQTQAEVDVAADQTGVGPQPAPGDLRLRDQNNDGVINQEDRVLLKGQFPSFNYSFNAGLSWRNFDFSAFFFGSEGRKIYVNGWGIEPFRQGSIPTTNWRNRWTPDNPSTTMPRLYTPDRANAVSGYTSTYFLKDASFFRLKNVTLGYNLPSKVVEKTGIGLSSLRIYFTGDNIFTISKYPGLDPERIDSGTYVSYPQVRSYTFGLDIKF